VSKAWRLVEADRASCTGRQCSHYRDCYLFKARDQVRAADLVVANHDLVLADLATGGGNVLPAPEETIYIFDESHHLPEKSRSHLSATTSLQAQKKQLGACQKVIKSIESCIPDEYNLTHYVSQFEQMDDALKSILLVLENSLQQLIAHGDETEQGGNPLEINVETGVCRFKLGKVDPVLTQHFSDWLACLQAKRSKLSSLMTIVTDVRKTQTHGVDALQAAPLTPKKGDKKSAKKASPTELLESAQVRLSAHAAQLDNAITVCDSYVNSANNEPHARWIALQESLGTSAEMGISSVPLSTGAILNRLLWQRCFAAILTSATLAHASHFKHFLEKLGYLEESSTLLLHGDFNYAESSFVVPKMRSLPNHAAEHTQEIIELIPDLVAEQAGSLVLFSSRKQMEEVEQALNLKLDILMQGARSKAKLLDQHRERVNEGKPSVLFGLASFAEGLDLPGDYCVQVIIAKLPFSVPEGPIEQALSEWIEAKGGNAFRDISLPEVSTRLMQACGRLLRKDTDQGSITLLDRRIATKYYGKQLLATLPGYTLKIEK